MYKDKGNVMEPTRRCSKGCVMPRERSGKGACQASRRSASSACRRGCLGRDQVPPRIGRSGVRTVVKFLGIVAAVLVTGFVALVWLGSSLIDKSSAPPSRPSPA
mgnify:CR=1 FL=1